MILSKYPVNLQLTAIVAAIYQYVVLKHFPFFNKEKAIDLIVKYVGVKYANIAAIISIQVVFRTFLIVLFEQIYTSRWFDRYKSMPEKEWLFIEDPEKYKKTTI